MDCKTARLLLDYARPAVPELDATDTQDLRSHLADCPDCAALERTEHAADANLGRVMRAVPIPDGLRDRLLTRLNAERDVRRRRRMFKYGGIGVAASILLFISIWLLIRPHPAKISLAEVHNELKQREERRGPEEVADGFRQMKIDTTPPPQFNYFFLSTYDLAVFEGKQVPHILFWRDGHYARVFILGAKDFDLEFLKNQPPVASGRFSVEVLVHPGKADIAYLVEYTGGSLEPFLVRNPGPLAQLRLDLSLASPVR